MTQLIITTRESTSGQNLSRLSSRQVQPPLWAHWFLVHLHQFSKLSWAPHPNQRRPTLNRQRWASVFPAWCITRLKLWYRIWFSGYWIKVEYCFLFGLKFIWGRRIHLLLVFEYEIFHRMYVLPISLREIIHYSHRATNLLGPYFIAWLLDQLSWLYKIQYIPYIWWYLHTPCLLPQLFMGGNFPITNTGENGPLCDT